MNEHKTISTGDSRGRIFWLVSALLIATLLIGPSLAQARATHRNFARTASMYLQSGPVLDSATATLSTFDLIVIPIEAQLWNPDFFSRIRSLNPNILILPYIATVSYNDLYWVDDIHKQMLRDIKPDWWLKDGAGQQLSVWPNTRALNLNTDWTDYLARHVDDVVIPSGLWDGVFYDEVQDSISWVGAVDVDRNGSADSSDVADRLWATNYERLFRLTRERIGENAIIMTNGSSNPTFFPYVNGRMFETFPSSRNTLSQWVNMTRSYQTVERGSAYDPITDNTGGIGARDDYQSVRFGLTTTLLGNGYFSYDEGTYNHSTLWTYDEFGVFLGQPKSALQNTFNPQNTDITQGVWEREFEQGKVIVNATEDEQVLELDGDFEKLHGLQDPMINDGSIVSQVRVASKDGLVLLRPIYEIVNTTFINGSFARIFNAEGNVDRTGFFAYDRLYRGGLQIIRFDTDTDGALETVVADDTFVSIYDDDGSLRARFAPYTESYDRGINISVGDLEDDGSVEIVTGTENGGGPHVRVFNADGVLINPGFFAYADSFRGGVNVTIGDLNGDNIKEIITGAGYNGGPHVRMFKKDGTLINPGFFAFDPDFRGGVNVASADVDGDGIDDVIAGPGLGGNGVARVFNRDGYLKSEFTVIDHNNRRGLKVAASDLDGDGVAEIIGLTTDVFTLSGF
jgi:hypothetical protein